MVNPPKIIVKYIFNYMNEGAIHSHIRMSVQHATLRWLPIKKATVHHYCVLNASLNRLQPPLHERTYTCAFVWVSVCVCVHVQHVVITCSWSSTSFKMTRRFDFMSSDNTALAERTPLHLRNCLRVCECVCQRICRSAFYRFFLNALPPSPPLSCGNALAPHFMPGERRANC